MTQIPRSHLGPWVLLFFFFNNLKIITKRKHLNLQPWDGKRSLVHK